MISQFIKLHKKAERARCEEMKLNDVQLLVMLLLIPRINIKLNYITF